MADFPLKSGYGPASYRCHQDLDSVTNIGLMSPTKNGPIKSHQFRKSVTHIRKCHQHQLLNLRWKAVSPPPPTFNCDFERGLCEGWRHLVTDDFEFEWDFNRGSTQTEKTGPSVDHTIGNSGKSSTNYGL